MKEEPFVPPAGVQPITTTAAPFLMRRVSWGAIFAGLFVTIVVQIILGLLGTAIGAATVNPTTESNPFNGLATGAGIWLIVTGLISLFCGAYVAGRLSGGPRRSDGLLHGILTFSVAEVAMLLLFTSAAGAIFGGTGGFLGNAFTSNQPTQGNAQNFSESATTLSPTGRTESEQTPGPLTDLARHDSQLAAALAQMAAQGGASQAPQERAQVINILTTKHSLSQQQADAMVNQWDQNFQQVKGQAAQTARQTGGQVAKGVSQAALWGFIGMILGLAVAAWGGWAGTASLPRYSRPGTVAAT